MFSSPIVINHNTSDMLVPVDSTSKTYTYENHDGSLPAEFSTRLPKGYPGILSNSLEEELPTDKVSTEKFNYAELPSEYNLQHRSGYQFSINIIDDGKVNAKNSHNQTYTTELKVSLYGEYLKSMFEKGLGKTEVLTNEKALLLLERYQGKSPQLPAHKNVDDTVYGSLAIYQKEIIDELQTFAKIRSIDELSHTMMQAIATVPSDQQEELRQAWEAIRGNL